VTTQRVVTFKAQRTNFDGETLTHVNMFVGKLILNFTLDNDDRLRLIELLTNARQSATVELHSIGPLLLPTGGETYLQITPSLLGVDEVSE